MTFEAQQSREAGYEFLGRRQPYFIHQCDRPLYFPVTGTKLWCIPLLGVYPSYFNYPIVNYFLQVRYYIIWYFKCPCIHRTENRYCLFVSASLLAKSRYTDSTHYEIVMQLHTYTLYRWSSCSAVLVIVSASSRAPPIFISFPTHAVLFFFSTPHITFTYAHLHILLSGTGGLMEGVHPPSPSSFTPRRSRPTVDFFCAPRRLPARTKLKSTCELREHLQDSQ